MNKKNKGGFTLIEMIVSIVIFAVIIIIAFDVIGNMGIMRIKQTNRIDVNQDLFYAVENLVTTIKDFGGDIDYEEYWNRQVIGIGTTNGYYNTPTGYGNYGKTGNPTTDVLGENYYYCASGNAASMGTGGCLSGFNATTANSTPVNYNGAPQRYGEYAFQFIDYNSNKTNDGGKPGDENLDGNIRGDDDDENLGMGPLSFIGNEVKELYLLKKGKISERFYLRLKIGTDTDAGKPAGSVCNTAGVGDGCLGKLQILKLTGKDLGMLHNATGLEGVYDGVVDTWQCSPNYSCTGANNIPKGIEDGWLDLTPGYINVKKATFQIYPNKDYKLAWKEDNAALNINPFIRINLSVGYSWEKRKRLKGADPVITLTTSINLTKN